MDKVPNPARWLLRIWDRLQASGEHAALAGWCVTLGLQPHDPRVFKALSAILDMTERTTIAVKSLNLPAPVTEQMLSWRPAFNRIIQLAAANSAWRNTHALFTEGLKTSLTACAVWLDQVCASESDVRQEIVDLSTELDSLLDAVKSADVDEEFRVLLLDIIESLRRALAEYEIRGMEGVDANIGEILATVLRGRDAVKRGPKGLWSRVWTLIDRTSKLGGLVRAGVLAVDGGRYLIEHIGP